MLFLIPTAKEMAFDKPHSPQPISDKTRIILDTLHQLTTDELAKCFHIKPEAATLEAQRIEQLLKGLSESFPALHLFNGLMYRHITRNLPDKLAKRLSEKVYITSALYGIIPCYHQISPHRLDFAAAITIGDKRLKQYWREDYDAFVSAQTEPIVSLLSSEFETVFSPSIKRQFITIAFMEEKDGQLKTHSTISKKARGAFLSHAIASNAKDRDDLTRLTVEGFRYQQDLSTDNHLVFIKKSDKP